MNKLYVLRLSGRAVEIGDVGQLRKLANELGDYASVEPLPGSLQEIAAVGYSGTLEALNVGLEKPRVTACGSVPPPPSSRRPSHLRLVR